jgi:hypothetical protein
VAFEIEWKICQEPQHNQSPCDANPGILDGHKFDGETIRLMGIAFEMALWSFP